MSIDDHRRNEISRRRVLAGLLAAGGLAGCSDAASSAAARVAVQTTAKASGLILPPGTRPDPTRPEGVDTLPQIEHIVIYMQENQSYDHYFGTLKRAHGFDRGPDGRPSNSNVDDTGEPVRVYHEADTCNTISGDHSWNGTHLSINGGAMDGFAKVSGRHVMGYYDETNLPFYRGLANTFPICDRWFASVPGPTYPNRRFLQAATSVGVVATDVTEVLATATAPNGTIWDRLNAHGISWTDYAIDFWDIELFPTHNIGTFLTDTAPHRKYYADFLSDCAAGTLPQVSILAPGVHDQYDEGSRDVQNGEAWSSSIINSVMNSPVWDKTVILMTWDEHGGGYDHVPPPVAIAPDSIAPRLKPGDQPGDFTRYGVRVGGLVISPFSRKDYVSHVIHDHTSITRFVETKFNLGAMTYRDANASNLLDCLDLRHPAFLDPPTLPQAGLPAAGSACQPEPRQPTNPRRSGAAASPSSTTTATSSTTPATTG